MLKKCLILNYLSGEISFYQKKDGSRFCKEEKRIIFKICVIFLKIKTLPRLREIKFAAVSIFENRKKWPVTPVTPP